MSALSHRLFALTCLLGLAAPVFATSGPWRFITRESGIAVHARDVPGRNLPEFRGTVVMQGHMLEILAVLDDTPRHVQWMANCSAAKLISKKSVFERVLYNRTDVPWPVSDRDVVLSTIVRVNMTKHEAWSRFNSIVTPRKPPVDGVVRMPELRGVYHLKALGLKHTRVVYQVAADPGGLLPDWLARMSTRKLPLKTLSGLQAQVRKMKGKYKAFIKRYDPAQGGRVPDRIRLDKPKPTPPSPAKE